MKKIKDFFIKIHNNKYFVLMMTFLNCFLCCLFMLPFIAVVDGVPEVLEHLAQLGSDSYLVFFVSGAFASAFFDLSFDNFERYLVIKRKEKEQN